MRNNLRKKEIKTFLKLDKLDKEIKEIETKLEKDSFKKGRNLEKIAMAEIENDGFVCWQPSRGKFSNNDLFGLWDFMCVSKDGSILRLVQVKSGHLKERRKPYLKKLKNFCQDYVIASKEYWELKKGKFEKMIL